MKCKVWFMMSHARAGGAERVYWILSQYFDKSKFEVSLVLLDASRPFFSTNLKDVSIIYLKSQRASKAFFKLCKLIKEERPSAIFSNGSHLNILMAMVSVFAPIPLLIGREANVPEEHAKQGSFKDFFWDKFLSLAYKRIGWGICQSEEIKRSLSRKYRIPSKKLTIIPNPVLATPIRRSSGGLNGRKLIAVGRLSTEKGLFRLIDIIKNLPEEYTLSIAGDGPLKDSLQKKIKELNLEDRITLLGMIKNVQQVISEHDVLVLPSFSEGFPNVVLEALSVGVPVVSFKVSGISAMIEHGFNGYVVSQNDLEGFKKKIILAIENDWDIQSIKADVSAKFGVHKVVKMYESLVPTALNGLPLSPKIAAEWRD
ncbi:glycosyltransferase [Desertivirga arenae]|uniref:glycosyltransferase n=1 Tax=Desertivirga arenae TaxID=2810309 RepID=UPI001A96EF69|nr:glycosyltransferase [Pedobacter sp. SYSU D00823]